jgi:hypothetical protein
LRATRTGRAVTRRTVRRPVSRPALDDAVFLVAGGGMVAVFDDGEAAAIQYRVMVGAGLDPLTRRVTVTRWAQMLSELQAHCPWLTISDARSERPAGTS